MWLATMVGWLATTAASVAADGKYRVQLVWGTDEARPEGKDMKSLDQIGRAHV